MKVAEPRPRRSNPRIPCRLAWPAAKDDRPHGRQKTGKENDPSFQRREHEGTRGILWLYLGCGGRLRVKARHTLHSTLACALEPSAEANPQRKILSYRYYQAQNYLRSRRVSPPPPPRRRLVCPRVKGSHARDDHGVRRAARRFCIDAFNFAELESVLSSLPLRSVHVFPSSTSWL